MTLIDRCGEIDDQLVAAAAGTAPTGAMAVLLPVPLSAEAHAAEALGHRATPPSAGQPAGASVADERDAFAAQYRQTSMITADLHRPGDEPGPVPTAVTHALAQLTAIATHAFEQRNLEAAALSELQRAAGGSTAWARIRPPDRAFLAAVSSAADARPASLDEIARRLDRTRQELSAPGDRLVHTHGLLEAAWAGLSALHQRRDGALGRRAPRRGPRPCWRPTTSGSLASKPWPPPSARSQAGAT